MRPGMSQGAHHLCAGVVPIAVVLSLLTGGLLVATLTGCGEKPSTGPYAGLFPAPGEVEHVTGAGEVTEYRDETLYDFLNGGAELYFDYDIVAVASLEYRLPEDSGIEISVYDMGEPRNAFGIFSIFRYAGADRADIGSEAIKTPATLDFWKGRYYCKLFAFGSSDVAEGVMTALGRSVADRISEAGSEPEILGLLPGEARISGSEKYFRRHLALNNIRYVDSENVLGLGDRTEGATAGYRAGEHEYTGYIIGYPTSAEAGAAFENYSSFLGAKAEERSQNGIKMFILDSGTTEAAALAGGHIVGIWDADTADLGFIEDLLATLAGED
jgi:hypothetical protein